MTAALLLFFWITVIGLLIRQAWKNGERREQVELARIHSDNRTYSTTEVERICVQQARASRQRRGWA